MTDLVFIKSDHGVPLVVRADGTLRLPTMAELAARAAQRARESDERGAGGRDIGRTYAELRAQWLEEVLAAGEISASQTVENGGLAVEPLIPGGLSKRGVQDVADVVAITHGDDQYRPECGDLRLERFHAFLERLGVVGHSAAPAISEPAHQAAMRDGRQDAEGTR